MRTSTIVFLAVAVIAGALTFSGLSESVANIAKGVYFIFMLLVAASVLLEPEDLESIRRPPRRTEPVRAAPRTASGPSLPVARERSGVDVR